jgi:type IV fimbrial biogenesis protein FimT
MRYAKPPAPGYTIVEHLVVLALAAILAGLAVPSFRELRANAVRDARLEELRSALLLARSEAVARGVPVVVCASEDGADCAGEPRWSGGWIARVEPPDDVPGAPLVLASASAAVRVHATRAAIEFQPTSSAATTATLTLCDERGVRAARALVVSRSGRVRTASGAELRCA